MENFAYGEINERSFSNPHPSSVPWGVIRIRKQAPPMTNIPRGFLPPVLSRIVCFGSSAIRPSCGTFVKVDSAWWLLMPWRLFGAKASTTIMVSQVEWCPITHTLLWRHNEHDSVSNHQPRGCLLNRLFRRRSKKTSKLRVTGHCVGNSPGPVNSPHKGPVTRKMFPFDDVIMQKKPYLTGVDYWLYVSLAEYQFPYRTTSCWVFH